MTCGPAALTSPRRAPPLRVPRHQAAQRRAASQHLVRTSTPARKDPRSQLRPWSQWCDHSPILARHAPIAPMSPRRTSPMRVPRRQAAQTALPHNPGTYRHATPRAPLTARSPSPDDHEHISPSHQHQPPIPPPTLCKSQRAVLIWVPRHQAAQRRAAS
jgi:hypothetical protein